ncbi:MAG TPA: biopolymer transporter ExbD, partial [Methylophilaceae bacterium]|nr:biopolymer transporter ExbD [Methylophilaceae bacterium]
MAIITNNDDEGLMGEINVTPLVDVMLVLLTVFIVTAPLLMNAVSVK